MRVYTGTSGFSYVEWKGFFYPEDLPNAELLSYYAGRLSTVEINNTFYRMPKSDVVKGWAEQVPAEFRFVLKASRRITHFKRLKEAEDVMGFMMRSAGNLGERLGAVLFQLPPNFPKDVDRLSAFLPLIPANVRAAFEFRHPTWQDDAVHAVLREHNAALCIADTEEDHAKVIQTADWGYLRLRRPGYSAVELKAWSKTVQGQNWRDVFVFFKHEDEGAGPRMAESFAALFN